MLCTSPKRLFRPLVTSYVTMKSRTFQPLPCLDVIQMARLLQNTSHILHLCYLMIRQRYWPVVLVDACKLVFSVSVIAKNFDHVVSFNSSDKHLITREYFGVRLNEYIFS
ncbi:hypothetical protein BX54_26600 [Escherichia coli O121:H19 str. 2010C-3840]|nr:hypothetical protein BX63_06480 [Escherichia coli O26:NM str. 2010C-4347]EYV03356.1 hypothetical protein BX54_26600 [Escherichia coli O121:H19 str. 2010C-3840]EYX81601.1 hypothetical protein BY04_17945 [Escherichia coli O156:H25 str. 2011C-3602]EYY71442.1 hypothetical protein BX75_09470 [Escherichia coli O26:NM str. 2010C-4788]EYZ01615.1 hypothetical protein BX68_25650 [Escherichia coli O177:NM str. 2010C-4558]EZG44051.1 hypothetical protein BW86_08345 [Escherichia coli O26:H11 str. 06-3464